MSTRIRAPQQRELDDGPELTRGEGHTLVLACMWYMYLAIQPSMRASSIYHDYDLTSIDEANDTVEAHSCVDNSEIH